MREIEDNINKQIWSLPQELFRNHTRDAKYELVVEQYKGMVILYKRDVIKPLLRDMKLGKLSYTENGVCFSWIRYN